MDQSPYIHAIIAIVLIVAIVFFVDLYINEQKSAGDFFENTKGTLITGNVVATQYGLEQCSPCTCIQKEPYTNGPLSFNINIPASSCSITTCQKEGEQKFGHPYWIARVREGSVACSR